MSRQDRWGWFSALQQQTRRLKPTSHAPGRGFALRRRLHIEALEDRRMLAAITVTSFADDLVVDGMVTLREAIQAANTDTKVDGSEAGNGIDGIKFSAALSGQTIKLNGELQITEALTIDATALANNVTIDADSISRIFNITATSGDFTLAGLTLSRGRTTGSNANSSDTTFNGGAIRSLTSGNLTIDQSTITGSSTTGERADGGGIFSAGTVTLTNSTVSGNSTTGNSADGGGIRAYVALTLSNSTVSGNFTEANSAVGGGIWAFGDVTLTSSTVSGNSTMGSHAYAGGIFSERTVALTSSTVSGNSTAGGHAYGGGILALRDVTLSSSTVSGNSTTGNYATGGGISSNGAVTLTSSTVSGNSTAGNFATGGGIFSRGNVNLTSSTVTDNVANHINVPGGGIWVSDTTITITHSIVSDNQSGGGNPDIHPVGTSVIDANYSLLGTAVTPDTGADNLFNNAPLLGPLASNGGPTETHALLGLSPAINAGDFNFDDAATPTDQRGAPFARVAGFRVDIGAFELQGTSSTDSADFDTDGDIDGRDFLLWQRGFGAPNANKYDGDADDNDNVNGVDLGIWQSQFGFPAPVSAASELSAISDQPSAELIDAAMALASDDQVVEASPLDEEPAFVETYEDRVFSAETIAPAGVFADEIERSDTISSDIEKAEALWLADDLLERVFG